MLNGIVSNFSKVSHCLDLIVKENIDLVYLECSKSEKLSFLHESVSQVADATAKLRQIILMKASYWNQNRRNEKNSGDRNRG